MIHVLAEEVKNVDNVLESKAFRKGSEILDYDIKKEIESLEKRYEDLFDSLRPGYQEVKDS